MNSLALTLVTLLQPQTQGLQVSSPPAVSPVGHKNEKPNTTISLYGAGKYGKFLRQFMPRSTVYTQQYTNKTIAYESLQGQIVHFSSVE